MKGSRVVLSAGFLLTTFAIGCTSQPAPPAAEQQTAPASNQQALPEADRQAEAGKFPDRDFTRLNLDKLQWRATENNTLGVQTASSKAIPQSQVSISRSTGFHRA